MAVLYCSGCGSDITRDSTKRRIDGPKSEHIVTCWKSFMAKVTGDASSASLPSYPAVYMCRSCNNTYDRYFDLQQKMKRNIVKFLDQVNASHQGICSPPSPKRMRLQPPLPPSVSPTAGPVSSHSSPDVKVGTNLQKSY